MRRNRGLRRGSWGAQIRLQECPFIFHQILRDQIGLTLQRRLNDVLLKYRYSHGDIQRRVYQPQIFIGHESDFIDLSQFKGLLNIVSEALLQEPEVAVVD